MNPKISFVFFNMIKMAFVVSDYDYDGCYVDNFIFRMKQTCTYRVLNIIQIEKDN